MAAANPGDVARLTREREVRRRLGDVAQAVIDVEGIFDHFQRVSPAPQTAALLTLAAVLHHQPEEEEL